MALKPGRKVSVWETGFIFDDTVTADQEAGGVASIKTTGSGEALDSSSAVVEYHSTGSGVTAVGVLVPKVKADNVITVPRNLHKDEVVKGQKVELVAKGWVVTNWYLGTPTAGAAAQLAASGYVALGTHSQTVGDVKVGHFMSTPDEDNYVKLFIDCPASA